MKKLSLLLIALSFAVLLNGCGGGPSDSDVAEVIASILAQSSKQSMGMVETELMDVEVGKKTKIDDAGTYDVEVTTKTKVTSNVFGNKTTEEVEKSGVVKMREVNGEWTILDIK